jgi:hypothetical protein
MAKYDVQVKLAHSNGVFTASGFLWPEPQEFEFKELVSAIDELQLQLLNRTASSLILNTRDTVVILQPRPKMIAEPKVTELLIPMAILENSVVQLQIVEVLE